MTFLSPFAGLIAAAVAVPALLLLYFLKLRRREHVVSSTVLWRKAIQDMQVNAPFQKLRRNLLLLLQMLVLAALCLALAQPTVPFKPTAGERTVLLIDRSASMNARDGDGNPLGSVTRLAEAKRRAKSLVDTLPRGGSAMVIAFDDRAEIVQGFTTDTAALRSAIDGIAPTDRRTRLKLAYQLADAQGALRGTVATEGPGSQGAVNPPDVFIYSDGRVLDGDEVSIRSKVTYEKIGSEKSQNVGIVALSARRNYERPTEVQVFCRLSNSGPNPVEADVQLTVDGAVQRVARVSLPPERWTEQQRTEAEAGGFRVRDAAEFTLDLPEAGVVRVEQMLKEGDVLSTDDSATVIVPPPRNLSVTLVTDGHNVFLVRLLRTQGLRDFTEITPAAYEASPPVGRDILVFDNYRPKKLPPAPAGGAFVYFGSLPDGLGLKAKKSSEGQLLQATEVQSFLDWKRDHPILANLALGKIAVQGALELEPASESEVIAEGTQGPLIVLHREGRQIHLAVAFDPLNSNWPFLVSWPMFMHNTFQYLATSSDLSVRETYAPGATPRVPNSLLANLGAVTTLTLTPPAGSGEAAQTVALPAAPSTADLALPALEKVGVYTLSPPPPGYERLAVSLLDNGESNVLPASAPPGGIGSTVATNTTRTRLELWWYLVLALAIPLLVIEWFVYTRRTHL